MANQVISGFFRRFGARHPLFAMHHYHNWLRAWNIFETIEGEDGIEIIKPIGAKGYGWKIRNRASKTATPELWDGRINESTHAIEVYCGDGTQPWFISPDGETGYAGTATGWQTAAAGTYYITMDDTLLPVFSTTAPNYSDSKYGVKVGTAAVGSWVKKFNGAFQMGVPPGDATHPALVWDDANGKWVKGTASGGGLVAGDFTEITVVTNVQISGQYLQIKTRTAKVYTPGTESSWTTIKTFPAFNS